MPKLEIRLHEFGTALPLLLPYTIYKYIAEREKAIIIIIMFVSCSDNQTQTHIQLNYFSAAKERQAVAVILTISPFRLHRTL